MSKAAGVIIDRVFAPAVSTRAWSRFLSAWVRAGEPGRVLKRDGPNVVLAAHLGGRGVVIKRWNLDGLSRLKAALGAGRGERHWSGAAWLARHKIATAPCLVLAHDTAGGTRRDYLVMERLGGPTVLEVLTWARLRDTQDTSGTPATPDQRAAAGRDFIGTVRSSVRSSIGVRTELAIARELGRQIARMITHGRFNRDHKPSNLIVVTRADGLSVAVIDCVAILPVSRGGGAGGATERMLASLMIEPRGLGVPPRRSLVLATVRAVLGLERVGSAGARASRRTAKRRIRGLWLSVAARVIDQGDSSPRVNPLAGDGAG